MFFPFRAGEAGTDPFGKAKWIGKGHFLQVFRMMIRFGWDHPSTAMRELSDYVALASHWLKCGRAS
jgi:hypothetical protein